MKNEKKELIKNFKAVIEDLLDNYEKYTDEEKAQIKDIFQKVADLNKILDKVLPYVSTSLDVEEMVGVLGEVNKYNIVAKDGFPFAQYRTTGNLGSKGSCVIPVDLKANVIEAHKFLFEAEEYEISEEVKSYSQKISADTGR